MSEVIASGSQRSSAPYGRSRFSPILGAAFLVVAIVIIMAAVGKAISPQDPNALHLSLTLAKPSASHWLGTDALGRDVFSRLIAGARTAFIGPLVIAGGSMLIGNLIGLLAGYLGGRADSVIMRWVDLMWAIPGLLVIIAVAGAVGGGYWLAVALLTFFTIPFDIRIVRGATLEQTPKPYVEAARTLGVADWRIMVLHIWPNVSPIAIANTFLVFAGSLVSLSGLSFLGLGAAPGTPDWGLMLADGQPLLFANPIAALAPGAMIVLTASSMSLIGDWLDERLSSKALR